MSKFEGKAGLPHPSKFLTNLKFLELTFCHKFFVFYQFCFNCYIYFYGNKTNYYFFCPYTQNIEKENKVNFRIV